MTVIVPCFQEVSSYFHCIGSVCVYHVCVCVCNWVSAGGCVLVFYSLQNLSIEPRVEHSRDTHTTSTHTYTYYWHQLFRVYTLLTKHSPLPYYTLSLVYISLIVISQMQPAYFSFNVWKDKHSRNNLCLALVSCGWNDTLFSWLYDDKAIVRYFIVILSIASVYHSLLLLVNYWHHGRHILAIPL